MPRRAVWQLIHWRPVLIVAVPFWLLLGVAVARVRPDRPVNVRPSPVVPVAPQQPADAGRSSEPTALTGVGPAAWFAITAAAVEPRAWPGVDVPPAGPFVADFIDPPPAADEPDDARVFGRMLDRPRPNPFIRDRRPPPAGQTLGTRVGWHPTPAAAFAAAAKSARLVLVVHTTADLPGDWFAGTDPTAMRSQVFARDFRVGVEPAIQAVVVRRSGRVTRTGGRITCYFCDAGGRVLHVVPGYVPVGTFADETLWASNLRYLAADDPAGYRQAVRDAHFEQLKREYRFILPVDATPATPFPPGLSAQARVHAMLAVRPLPTIGEIVPTVWERVLGGD